MSRRMRTSSDLTKLIATPLRPNRPDRPMLNSTIERSAKRREFNEYFAGHDSTALKLKRRFGFRTSRLYVTLGRRSVSEHQTLGARSRGYRIEHEKRTVQPNPMKENVLFRQIHIHPIATKCNLSRSSSTISTISTPFPPHRCM